MHPFVRALVLPHTGAKCSTPSWCPTSTVAGDGVHTVTMCATQPPLNTHTHRDACFPAHCISHYNSGVFMALKIPLVYIHTHTHTHSNTHTHTHTQKMGGIALWALSLPTSIKLFLLTNFFNKVCKLNHKALSYMLHLTQARVQHPH